MFRMIQKRIVLLCITAFFPLFIYALNADWTFPPATISTTGINGTSPSIAIDPSGNALIVWVENGFVLSRSGTEIGGWGASTTISGSGASNPLIGMDGLGNAIAVWVENGLIKSQNKPANQAWSGITTTLSAAGASSPQFDINSNGAATVVWLISDALQAVTGTFNTGWGSVQTISASGASSPQVAIDSAGNSVAVWVQLASSIPTIYSSSLPSGGSWSTSTMISTLGQNCASPSIDATSSGDEKAIAVWFSYDVSSGNYYNVYAQAASLQLDGSWGGAISLSYAGKFDPHQYKTKVLIDPYGAATAMWNYSQDGSFFNYMYSSKPKGGYWSVNDVLIIPNAAASGFDVTGESDGDVISCWMTLDDTQTNLIVQTAIAGCQQLYVDQGSQGEGSGTSTSLTCQLMWGDYQTLSQGSSSGYPIIASNSSNNYVYLAASWLSFDGANTIVQASLGGVDDPFPPTGLAVSQAIANYGLLNDTYNTLTWTASVSIDVYAYKIFRNGIYITTVPSSQLQWVDHNQVANQSVTYGVQAVITSQIVSEMATVTWP
ncbi:MAG: hypothetical protein JSR39_02330 [Verrucomicrobia bacterium]|nr:hypothetical protein [Verrucomicrobiota bacterium]